MTHLTIICGADEAGRGPLAGPVVAAAVILNPDCPIEGLADSKKLSEKKRNVLADIIRRDALAWAIASASVEEIDTINILQASLLAMRRAIEQLTIQPQCIRIDGRDCPAGFEHTDIQAVIHGDSLIPEISAASILAKTERDRLMIELDAAYPQYGFKQHKGYPTKQHMAALMQYGPSPIHRRSYKPVKDVMQQYSAQISAISSKK